MENQEFQDGSDYPAMPFSITNKSMQVKEVLGTKILPGDKGTWHGLSKREYAAIHLRVPMSGETWLDDMIRASLESSVNLVTPSEDSPEESGAPDWSDAPDWKDAPKWANWVAQDSDGWWYWYQIKPELLSASWSYRGGKYGPAKRSNSDINWQSTLQQRPETK